MVTILLGIALLVALLAGVLVAVGVILYRLYGRPRYGPRPPVGYGIAVVAAGLLVFALVVAGAGAVIGRILGSDGYAEDGVAPVATSPLAPPSPDAAEPAPDSTDSSAGSSTFPPTPVDPTESPSAGDGAGAPGGSTADPGDSASSLGDPTPSGRAWAAKQASAQTLAVADEALELVAEPAGPPTATPEGGSLAEPVARQEPCAYEPGVKYVVSVDFYTPGDTVTNVQYVEAAWEERGWGAEAAGPAVIWFPDPQDSAVAQARIGSRGDNSVGLRVESRCVPVPAGS